jgi:hypothetical protein
MVRGTAIVGPGGSELRAQLHTTPARPARAAMVGQTTRRVDLSGRMSFSVRLSRTASATLQRRGKLRVTLTVRVIPPSGTPVVSVRRVLLRRGGPARGGSARR